MRNVSSFLDNSLDTVDRYLFRGQQQEDHSYTGQTQTDTILPSLQWRAY